MNSDNETTELPDSPSPSTSKRHKKIPRVTAPAIDKCDEVLQVIGKRLFENTTTNKFTDIGKAWASKLKDLNPHQAVHAEKLINDVFYEAQLGNLNRSCFVQVAHTQPSQSQFTPLVENPIIQIHSTPSKPTNLGLFDSLSYEDIN